VEKCSTDGRQVITWWCTAKMAFVCLITKPRIQTHSHNIHYLLLFHDNNCYENAPPLYIWCTLPVLLLILISGQRHNMWICSTLFSTSRMLLRVISGRILSAAGKGHALILINPLEPCGNYSHCQAYLCVQREHCGLLVFLIEAVFSVRSELNSADSHSSTRTSCTVIIPGY
jgi:hypothetical protein